MRDIIQTDHNIIYYYTMHCFVRPNEFGRICRALSIILYQTMPLLI